jgi:hypothetical protein
VKTACWRRTSIVSVSSRNPSGNPCCPQKGAAGGQPGGALSDISSSVRWQAARVIGELGEAHAITALQELEDDPDEEVRRVVASSLRKPGARNGPQLPEPGPHRHILNIYADYNQFYMGDASFEGDTGTADFWSPDAVALKLAVSPPGLVGVGTARYEFVPIVVEVVTRPPLDEPDQWDHVVEASLELPSELLAIDGCTSYRPDSSPHIELPPGTYRLRVSYAGLNSFDEDWYRVVLWPQSPYEPPRIPPP